MQGDCLSAIFFIYYLAGAVKEIPSTKREDHRDVLWSALDWLVRNDQQNIDIDPKYSDDLSFVRSMKAKINTIKRTIPTMLKEADLIDNSDKKEEYMINRNSNDNWIFIRY